MNLGGNDKAAPSDLEQTVRQGWASSARTALVALAVIVLMTAGVLVRGSHLAYPPLTLDEAESAVNALTILERGVPGDSYLGLPLFENTLVRPWPENAEYEFRDVSYSDRGFAVYHGWLPLYAMAASYALIGVRPDAVVPAGEVLRVRHDAGEVWRRTVGARVPAVVFGGLFVVAAFCAARAMAGDGAGLCAAALAALADPCVGAGRYARYNSAALLVSTLTCWALWRVLRRGRAVDNLLCGAAMAVAFHTHALLLAVAGTMWLATLPWTVRREGGWAGAGIVTAVVVLAVVPWAVWTGFPGAARMLPAARERLAEVPAMHAAMIGGGAATLGMLAVLASKGEGWWPRGHRIAREVAGPVLLTGGWVVAGLALFYLLVPAASAFVSRAGVPVIGPGMLVAGILAAYVGRWVSPRHGAAVMAAMIVGVMLAKPGRAAATALRPPIAWDDYPAHQAYAELRTMTFPPGTRLYAVPTEHFSLMLMTGLPVQSVAPVRREFLDRYAGAVIVIDAAAAVRLVTRDKVNSAASARGVSLGDEDAEQWVRALSERALREDLASRVARVEPVLEPLPAFAADAVAAARRLGPPRQDADGTWQNPFMFRGREAWHRSQFWPTFFYRYVDPEARSGAKVNYATRVARGSARVLRGGWVLYHSPALETADTGADARRQP